MAPVTEKADPRIHDSRRDRFGPTRAPGWLRRAAAAAATAVVLAVLLPGATPQLAELEALLAAAARFEAVGRVCEARAHVLTVQAMHPAHPAPGVALQRLDTAHCPLPPGSSLAASDNLPECTWRFAVSTAASEQCRLSAADACDADARMGKAGGDSGSDQPAKGGSTVHIVEVQQGECGVLLEGERRRQLARVSALQQGSGGTSVFGVSFVHDDPETLREITDMDDVDVVALEGCEKGARASTRWHSVRLRLAPAMLDEGLLTWVEGTDPYLTARLFAKYENLDSSVIYPVYKLVVARNNAVRGRGNQGSPPPWTIPAALEAEFTMGSAVRVTQHYVDESDAESRDHYSFGFYQASHAEIEGLVDKVYMYLYTCRPIIQICTCKNIHVYLRPTLRLTAWLTRPPGVRVTTMATPISTCTRRWTRAGNMAAGGCREKMW